MSEDRFKIGFLGFNLSLTKKDNQIKLKEGETILLRYWNWKKFGYIRKAYSLHKGRLRVMRVDWLIEPTDPKHKEIVNEIDDGNDYEILTEKLDKGESIQCADDKDMLVIKNMDGTITLNKKCFSTNCFTK